MEKILFITPYAPSTLGAAVKNTKIMIKDLSTKYEVDLIYFKSQNEDLYEEENERIHVLKKYPVSTFHRLLGVLSFPFLYPVFTVRFKWKIRKFIKEVTDKSKYKAIIFDHSQVFLYAKLLNNDTPKLLISHDVISQRVARSSNKLIARFTKQSEKYVLNTPKSSAYTFNFKDCDLLQKLCNDVNLCLDYIDPLAEKAIPNEVKDYFVFLAYWGRPENYEGLHWFYKEVIPKISKPTTLKIIGKDLDEKFVRHNNPNVKTEILGFVEDPYPIIADAKAVISPLFQGAGIKVKVIESFACGAPVLGTDIAFEGFDSKYNKFMFLCEKPNDFIKGMTEISFSIEERKKFKAMFMESYKSKTMLNYVDEL